MRKYFISVAFVAAYSLTVSAQENQDFYVTGSIGTMTTGPIHAVQIRFVAGSATIEYPDLGCSGQLLPVYELAQAPYASLQEDGGLEFTEVVSGPDCPTGGSLAILADGVGGWIVSRQGGSTGARRWEGPVELALGTLADTMTTDVAAELPPGTVAGDPELGLFLGDGPSLSGIGPTSTVTGLVDGSPAETFGLVTGDTILAVNNGAGDPAAHIQMMHRDIARAGTVALLVLGTDGNNRMVDLHMPLVPIVRAQLVAAARDDEFGPPNDRMSFRLRLMADGAYEAMEFLSERDRLAWGRPPVQDFSLILAPGDGSRTPPYAGLIASYSVARLQFLGDCGESLTPMRLNVVNVWETRRGGVVTNVEDFSYSIDFETVSKFAPIVRDVGMREQPGAPGWTTVLRQFGPSFEGLSCDSAGLRDLEANMLEYYSR